MLRCRGRCLCPRGCQAAARSVLDSSRCVGVPVALSPHGLVCTTPGWCWYVLVASYRSSRTLWPKSISPCRFNRMLASGACQHLGNLHHAICLPAEVMGKEAHDICFPKPSSMHHVSSASENSTPPLWTTFIVFRKTWKKANIPSPPKCLQTSEPLTDGFEQNPIFSWDFCQITKICRCYWQFWDLIYVAIFMLRGRKAFRDIETVTDTMFFHFKEWAKNNFVEKEKLHAYWDRWLIFWGKTSQL